MKFVRSAVAACAKALTRIQSPILVGQRSGESSQRKTTKRSLNIRLVTKFMHLNIEMNEISEEQNGIKEGQKQVKEKFEALETECQNLRRETILITRQSAFTKLRLDLMFQILRARENNDFAKAAELTLVLRELIAEQNQNGQALEPNDGGK